jgi:hypothetical protein
MLSIYNQNIRHSLYILLITGQFITFFNQNISAQAPKKMTSGEIYQDLEKLGFLGSVLYVAAHPDDENTRIDILSGQ